MVKLNMYYYKHTFIIFAFIVGILNVVVGQGNCLLYPEGSGNRKACETCYEASEFRQGSKESQLLFDKAIELGQNFAWAYYQKSVPFFKRGLFADGVQLINKAIELEPQTYLYYRAYWYFYNRSYEACIRDLEELYTIYKPAYITSSGGEMEMRLLLALSYAQKGNVSKGIYWIKDLMASYSDRIHLKGLYDHYCLGVLYFINNQFDLAMSEFEKQIEVDANFSDTYYYIGLIKESSDEHFLAQKYFKRALAGMKRENGGYSVNIFEGYNLYQKDVELKFYK